MQKEIKEILGSGLLVLSICPFSVSCIGFAFGIENVRSISGFVLGLIGIFIGWLLIFFRKRNWIISIVLSFVLTWLIARLSLGFSLVIAEKADFLNPHMIAGIILILPLGICIKWYSR